MTSLIDEIAYLARQSMRVSWFLGHAAAARRTATGEGGARRSPASARLTRDLLDLFRQDLRNVRDGRYPSPRDHDGGIAANLALSREFFADMPDAIDRKAQGRGREVYTDALASEFPDYFLQNFHYQSGGYLTPESARLYDMQVEVLFSGSANAMRRQCLVPLAEFLRGRDQRDLRLLDVGCGTGRFLRFVKEAFPRLEAAGVDLSSAYLEEAARHLAPFAAELRSANAEALPFPDGRFDLVTSVYLYHEVPPGIRRTIARELSRVLVPGGRLVFMDSLQLGDVSGYDSILESFPVNFHEPYYAGYLRDDLKSLFAEAGLDVVSETPVFLSKRIVAEKRR